MERAPEFEDLVRQLQSRDSQVVEEAAIGLAQIGDPAAVPHLLSQLSGTTPIDVAHTVEECLTTFGELALEPLISALRENVEDESMRVSAARVLGSIGDPRAADALAAFLADPSDRLRTWAALGLGQLGDVRAATSLTALVEDSNTTIAETAATGLQRIAATDARRGG